jgi:hypothetical protein
VNDLPRSLPDEKGDLDAALIVDMGGALSLNEEVLC